MIGQRIVLYQENNTKCISFIQPAENIYPEQLGILEGVEVWLPNKVEPGKNSTYLDTYYGKGKWETPLWKCNETKRMKDCVKTT